MVGVVRGRLGAACGCRCTPLEMRQKKKRKRKEATYRMFWGGSGGRSTGALEGGGRVWLPLSCYYSSTPGDEKRKEKTYQIFCGRYAKRESQMQHSVLAVFSSGGRATEGLVTSLMCTHILR